MGLILKSTKKKSIRVHGLSIVLPTVLVRLEPNLLQNGKDINSTFFYYEDDESRKKHTENAPTNLNIVLENKEGLPMMVNGLNTITLKEGEIQSLEIVHQYSKIAFESAGYECEIVL